METVAKTTVPCFVRAGTDRDGWCYYLLHVCLQAVYCDKFMRTVIDTPTLGMETSNDP